MVGGRGPGRRDHPPRRANRQLARADENDRPIDRAAEAERARAEENFRLARDAVDRYLPRR